MSTHPNGTTASQANAKILKIVHSNQTMANLALYAGILVIIAAAAFAFYLNVSTGKQSKATAPQATTLPNATTIATTTMLSSTTTILQNQTFTCESENSTLPIGGGNFSTGTFYGWEVSGTGFGNAPLNLSTANNDGHYYTDKWSNSNYPFAATTFSNNKPMAPGSISFSYIPTLPYLNFQIFSPASKELYIKVVPSRGHSSVYYYNTLNVTGNTTDEFEYASINMSALMCQKVTVEIVSNISPTVASSGIVLSNQNLFIAVTGFYQSASGYQTSGIQQNFS